MTKSAVLAQSPQRYLTTYGRGNAPQLLVGRIDDDDAVTGRQELIEEEKVGLDSAGGDQHVVNRRVLVRIRNETPQLGAAAGLTVAKPQIEQLL